MTVSVHGLTLDIRPYGPDDRAFVTSRWVRSYSASRAQQPHALYRARWNHLVDVVLDRSLLLGKVSVACSPRDPDAILGFCATEGDVLHYVYVVPKLFRGGLGKALIASNFGEEYPARVVTTHRWPWDSPRFCFDFYPLLGL